MNAATVLQIHPDGDRSVGGQIGEPEHSHEIDQIHLDPRRPLHEHPVDLIHLDEARRTVIPRQHRHRQHTIQNGRTHARTVPQTLWITPGLLSGSRGASACLLTGEASTALRRGAYTPCQGHRTHATATPCPCGKVVYTTKVVHTTTIRHVTSSVEIAIAHLHNASLHLDPLPTPWPTVLDEHIRYIERLAPNALANLRNHTADGWGTTTSAGDIGGGATSSGHTTSVESATIGRALISNGRAIGTTAIADQLATHLRTATAHITTACTDRDTNQQRHRARTANDELKAACRIINEWHTLELGIKSRLTCNCGQLDGWLEWGDPLCEMIASRSTNGLCSGTRDDGTPGCHQRRDAWRKRQEYARRRIDPRRRNALV